MQLIWLALKSQNNVSLILKWPTPKLREINKIKLFLVKELVPTLIPMVEHKVESNIFTRIWYVLQHFCAALSILKHQMS